MFFPPARVIFVLVSVRPSVAFRWLVGFLLAVGSVYGAVFLETGARARSSFLEAEGFRRWVLDSAAMGRDLEAEFVKANDHLTGLRARGKITAGELRLDQDILQARFDMRRVESPSKRAYFAYRDVYRLYSPPESDLSRRARLFAPAAQQSWREDVERRGSPASSAMFDGDGGETSDRRVVYSTRDRFEAENLSAILRVNGISTEIFHAPRGAEVVEPEFWIRVPGADFWRAHGQLQSLLAPDLSAGFVKS